MRVVSILVIVRRTKGNRPAERGAVTPYLLATTNEIFSGMHWFDEKQMQWSY
jgi:hypothetical protein